MTQNILLIGEDGNKIGNISFDEATKIAKEQDKDLMLVNGANQVYRLGDEGRIKYEKKRKERKQRAQQRAQKIKEIQMSPVIENADLEVKVRHTKKFLSDGLKTKLIMKFKRQQVLYIDVGMKKMTRIVEEISKDGLATVDGPTLEGMNIIAFLIPNKHT